MMTAGGSIFAPVTFGEHLCCREANGLRIIETFHRPYFKLAPHEHEDPTIVAAISGGWDEHVESRSFTCRPGSFLVKSAGARHANSYGSERTRSLVIQLTVTRAATWESSRKVFGALSYFESPKLAMRLVALLREPSGHSNLALQEELFSLFSFLAGEKAAGRRQAGLVIRLKRARDRLLDQSFPTIDLTGLAQLCEMTPSAFTHAFKSEFGCTPSRLVRHRRVENASLLLRTSRDSLSQIAARAGFADQAHMTREFRRFAELTPGRYRQLVTA
jgi:AraC-like DNA-binding protein